MQGKHRRNKKDEIVKINTKNLKKIYIINWIPGILLFLLSIVASRKIAAVIGLTVIVLSALGYKLVDWYEVKA